MKKEKEKKANLLAMESYLTILKVIFVFLWGNMGAGNNNMLALRDNVNMWDTLVEQHTGSTADSWTTLPAAKAPRKQGYHF